MRDYIPRRNNSEKIIKGVLCAIVTAASIFSLAAPALAEDTAEKVTLIVQMENGSTVEQMNAAAQLSKANSKDTERNVTNRILKEQKTYSGGYSCL